MNNPSGVGPWMDGLVDWGGADIRSPHHGSRSTTASIDRSTARIHTQPSIHPTPIHHKRAGKLTRGRGGVLLRRRKRRVVGLPAPVQPQQRVCAPEGRGGAVAGDFLHFGAGLIDFGFVR